MSPSPSTFTFNSPRPATDHRRLHWTLLNFVWTVVVVLLLIATNPSSVCSQLSPVMYPSTGRNTNPAMYGTRQLSLYPMAMISSQFGSAPRMNTFPVNGYMPPGSQYAQMGRMLPAPMMGMYPPSSNSFAQFGMPPMLGSNYGQQQRPPSGSMPFQNGGGQFSNNNMGGPPMNMGFGGSNTFGMNSTRSSSSASTPRYF